MKTKKENKVEASITVADMMAALSALPPDARLVVTESGYYSYGELARVGLPEAYTIEGDEDDIPRGTVVYRIGHSHQSYWSRLTNNSQSAIIATLTHQGVELEDHNDRWKGS